MKEKQLNVINKIFDNERIRIIWNNVEGKYYISVVDVVRVLSESENPQVYWRVMKKRLKDEGNETVTNCNALKLRAEDGKYRMTDVVDVEGMFRIVESIPSKNAEPFKLWLAKLGKERIDETVDPSIAIERAIDTYRRKGYDNEWIIKRLKTIIDRKKLTDVWNENGINSEKEYAMLTNEIYKEWSGMTAKEYKDFKGLKKESLRDNMNDIEFLLADLGEIVTRELAKKNKPYGLDENMKVAKEGGEVASNTRRDIESRLNEDVITNNFYLDYVFVEDKYDI